MRGTIEANNGETLGQLAAAGVGIARVGALSVIEDIAPVRLVAVLEADNPGDVELIHAAFVDLLAARLAPVTQSASRT